MGNKKRIKTPGQSSLYGGETRHFKSDDKLHGFIQTFFACPFSQKDLITAIMRATFLLNGSKCQQRKRINHERTR